MRSDYTCLVTAFEIGSLGYMSPRKQSAMYTLHKLMKPWVKLTQFKKNISAMSVYSSYYIFITRKEPMFCQTPFLLPPFKVMLYIWTLWTFCSEHKLWTSCLGSILYLWSFLSGLDNLWTKLLYLFSVHLLENINKVIIFKS